MKHLALSLILILGFSVFAVAQSTLLPRGKDGFIVNGGLSSAKNVFGYSTAASFSAQGVLDVGVALGRFKSNVAFFNSDMDVASVTPFISMLLVKEDESRPFSLSLNGTFQRQTFSDRSSGKNFTSYSAEFFTYGATITNTSRISNKLRIQPIMGFDFIRGKFKRTYSSDFDIDPDLFFTFGVSFIFQETSPNALVFTPVYSFGGMPSSIGLTASLMFARKNTARATD